jgi:hypothetical protein
MLLPATALMLLPALMLPAIAAVLPALALPRALVLPSLALPPALLLTAVALVRPRLALPPALLLTADALLLLPAARVRERERSIAQAAKLNATRQCCKQEMTLRCCNARVRAASDMLYLLLFITACCVHLVATACGYYHPPHALNPINEHLNLLATILLLSTTTLSRSHA